MEMVVGLAQENCFHSFRFTATDTVVLHGLDVVMYLVGTVPTCPMPHASIAIEICTDYQSDLCFTVATMEKCWWVLRR